MELVLYIAILLVFLLAYGISIQSLMFPIRKPYWLIFKDIFYYPYWQIYGELYLEELEGTFLENRIQCKIPYVDLKLCNEM